MIDNIVIRNNFIELFVDERDDVEKFIKLCTALDNSKAAKTLFSHEVRIEYRDDKKLHIIKLIANQDFTYNEVSNLVNHIIYNKIHSLCINYDKISELLTKAWKDLMAKDLVFCVFCDQPNFSVEVYRSEIILRPISKKYINILSKDTEKLISLFKKNDSLYNCNVNENHNYISIIRIVEIHRTVDSLVNILSQEEIIEESDKEFVKKQIVNLAFKDFTVNELKVIKNLAKQPSQYQDVAKDIENIFSCLLHSREFDSENVKKLKEAINSEGKFSNAPDIVKRSLSRLNKNFYCEIENIINNSVRH